MLDSGIFAGVETVRNVTDTGCAAFVLSMLARTNAAQIIPGSGGDLVMTAFHVMAGAEGTVAHPGIRKIGVSDVFDALSRGWADFREKPSHYVFLGLIYPIAGVVLAAWSSGANMLPLLYPLASGFALIGRSRRSVSTRSAGGAKRAWIRRGVMPSTSGIRRQCRRSWRSRPCCSCCLLPGW